MFKINEYIIYGGNGVCKVVDIGTPDLCGDSIKKVILYFRATL